MGTSDQAEQLLPVLLRKGIDLLERFDLSNNPWELPPAAVVAACRDGIRGYYNELQESATDPQEIQSLKAVFAGDSGAGKTRYVESSPMFVSATRVAAISSPAWSLVLKVHFCRKDAELCVGLGKYNQVSR